MASWAQHVVDATTLASTVYGVDLHRNVDIPSGPGGKEAGLYVPGSEALNTYVTDRVRNRPLGFAREQQPDPSQARFPPLNWPYWGVHGREPALTDYYGDPASIVLTDQFRVANKVARYELGTRQIEFMDHGTWSSEYTGINFDAFRPVNPGHRNGPVKP